MTKKSHFKDLKLRKKGNDMENQEKKSFPFDSRKKI